MRTLRITINSLSYLSVATSQERSPLLPGDKKSKLDPIPKLKKIKYLSVKLGIEIPNPIASGLATPNMNSPPVIGYRDFEVRSPKQHAGNRSV